MVVCPMETRQNPSRLLPAFYPYQGCCQETGFFLRFASHFPCPGLASTVTCCLMAKKARVLSYLATAFSTRRTIPGNSGNVSST